MSEDFELPRTFGRTKDCRGCRYWSELNWRQRGSRAPEAQCLNRNSRKAYLFTKGRDWCDDWVEGEYGAVDDPDNKGVY